MDILELVNVVGGLAFFLFGVHETTQIGKDELRACS